MRRSFVCALVACAAWISALVGCDEAAAPPPTARTQASGESCEHGVLESLCPECHPALAPVYRAHGDWCEEHQMPESFCPTCHPERGGRPTAAIDDAVEPARAAADGTRVTLVSPEMAARAGLATVTLEAPRDTIPVHATARLTHDLSRIARLSARVPGVVADVEVEIGDRVEAGAVLPAIASSAVGADRSRAGAAAARRATAEATLARATELRSAGVGSERELLAAREELAAARAEHDALRASLRAVGGGGASRYSIVSPIAGVVTARAAVVGAQAETSDVLFEIVDASVLWAELAVPERDAARVAVGAPVSLRVLGLDERAFDTTLAFVSPAIDPHTRSVLARARVDNAGGALRVNALANAVIDVPAGAPLFVVPSDALQEVDGVSMVFVRVTEVAYEVRRVERLGEPDARTRLVTGRLAVGDRVVTVGSFLLRTETMRSSIGAGCCAGER